MKKKFSILLFLTFLTLGCTEREAALMTSYQESENEILYEVTTTDPDYLEVFPEGIIPWISIENAADQVQYLIGKNDLVLLRDTAIIIIDYPVSEPFEIKISSDNPKGFTRAELILKISAEYRRIYREEEESATTKTVQLEDRQGLINRNTTNGKYGIWGHDLIDLDLSAIYIHKNGKKHPKLELFIES